MSSTERSFCFRCSAAANLVDCMVRRRVRLFIGKAMKTSSSSVMIEVSGVLMKRWMVEKVLPVHQDGITSFRVVER